MDLTHDFTVPASLEDTWAALNDIEGVAGCFPGATITAADGDSFEGSVKVKLGPIALVYKGSGAFVEKDEAGHRLVIEAKGKDKRGNGTAGADVVATLAAAADGTRVTVVTDLSITGKPAQFGRGVMQDVSDKLLGQFVECVADRLGPAAPASPATGTPETDTADDQGGGPAAVPGQPEATVDAPPPAVTPEARPAPARDDAIDLGTTVLPVLMKTYWRQALGVSIALLLLRRLLRRRAADRRCRGREV